MDPASTCSTGSVCDALHSSFSAPDVPCVSVSTDKHHEEEIDALVKYFNEDEGSHAVPTYWRESGTAGNSIQRKKIAAFLEGSRLPFSALVKDVFEKLSGENDQDQSKVGVVTLASVRSIVLSLGERISFGITNPDTDVLEDETVRSLWRWEVRDVKLLPRGSREEILDRRRWRKKIAERITALSVAVEALNAKDMEGTEDLAYIKAREALAKTDNASAIRAARMAWQLKKVCAISAQETAAKLKDPLTEQPNNVTQVSQEAGRKRRLSDPEKEKLRQEKLLKRQQVENEKEQKRKEKEEQKRREKEEGERKKQEKKQQDEAEKEQKREAERKKQLALRKQASLMDRFLVKKDQATCVQSDQADPLAQSPPGLEVENHESADNVETLGPAAVVTRMDIELNTGTDVEGLLRTHINKWLVLRSQYASQKVHSWAIRRKPKVSVYTELRLQGTVADLRPSSQDESLTRKATENSNPSSSLPTRKAIEISSPSSSLKRSREEFDCSEDLEHVTELCPTSPFDGLKKLRSGRYHYLRNKRRKLLQFDKSHRPPYYGTFSKKSDHIKPRRPLRKDPMLDYEVDSDEEWEEEDPGESLSDVEKDEEDDKVDSEEIEDDEEAGDEFVVPDGYLSEDEGVAMEDSGRGEAMNEGPSSDSPVATGHSNTVTSIDRLRKVLDSATEHALRSNRPLVVNNLGHVPGCEEISSSEIPSSRIENMCLEALRIRVLIPNLLIEAC